MAENRQDCILAGKNIKPMCSKGNLGRIPEPKEPNEAIQLNFWGLINYLPESKKYVIVAADRFSRWPSAMVCNPNPSDKILKILKQFKNNHGVPRRIHVDQGTNCLSHNVKTFCNAEGIEIVQSPESDHRATGCVERTSEV